MPAAPVPVLRRSAWPTAASISRATCSCKGDLPAAADLCEQAIELAPNFASAWFTLGEIRQQLGERDKAIEAFRKARDCDPEDRHGAALHLMQLGAEHIGGDAQGLCAGAVRPIRAALRDTRCSTISTIARRRCCSRRCWRRASPRRSRPSSSAPSISAAAPGLRRAAFAKQVDHFIGIDLSPGMIEQARASGLYAELEVADMMRGLRSKPDASADPRARRRCHGLCLRSRAGLSEAHRVLASGG